MSETGAYISDAIHSLTELGIAPSRAERIDFSTPPIQVSHSTLSVRAIKDLVLPNYDLEDDIECVPFLRAVSNTYLLSSRTRRLALKVYPPNWRSHDAILGELRTLLHLQENGADVVVPIRRRDRTFITDINAPEGLRRAVLFQWINGRAPAYTDSEQARRYGGALAKMHRAASELRLNTERPVMDSSYLLTGPLKRIASRLKGRPELSVRLNALGERTSVSLDCAQSSLRDWGLCHGDLHAGNARIDGDRVILFDFDHCGSGWRLVDLASYRLEARRLGVEKVAWAPFVDGYREVRPTDPLELMGLFMILRYLWTTADAIQLSEAGIGVFFPPDDEIDELVPFCERIEAEFSNA